MAWLSMSFAVLASIAAAFAFRLALNWRSIPRTLGLIAAAAVVALAPCLIPPDAQPHRAIFSLLTIAILVKLYDAWSNPAWALAASAPAFAGRLFNVFWLASAREPPSVPAAEDRRRLARSLPAAAGMTVCCVVVFSRDYSAMPFAVEHAIKATTMVLTAVAASGAASSLWRLCAGPALPMMRHPELATTPADFWRRWNIPVYQFLGVHVFKPAGGVRHPVRATLAAFFVSGLVHEYTFAVALGRVQGLQLLFFTLQGLAAAATLHLRPRGWLVWPSWAATAAFNLATSVLFFHCVNQGLPFYWPRTR